jgi:hypothetical protein
MIGLAPRTIPPGPLLTQVHNQRERILASFSEAELEEIEAQRQDLASAYQKEQTLKACLDKSTDCSTVGDAWD